MYTYRNITKRGIIIMSWPQKTHIIPVREMRLVDGYRRAATLACNIVIVSPCRNRSHKGIYSGHNLHFLTNEDEGIRPTSITKPIYNKPSH